MTSSEESILVVVEYDDGDGDSGKSRIEKYRNLRWPRRVIKDITLGHTSKNCGSGSLMNRSAMKDKANVYFLTNAFFRAEHDI